MIKCLEWCTGRPCNTFCSVTNNWGMECKYHCGAIYSNCKVNVTAGPAPTTTTTVRRNPREY